MRFFEAAANWADQKYVDVKFARDHMDGWFAIIELRDARGAFSATVDEIAPLHAESDDDFEKRVGAALVKATARAREARVRARTGCAPMARAA